MPDKDKKGGDQNIPKPGAGGPSIVSAFKPQISVQKNDILTSDVGGWWVCLAPHTTGQVFHLKVGQSDDLWHWSQGAS